MADRVGQKFGDYRLLRLLGKGGFAEVYLAERGDRGTQVALKVMHAVLMNTDVERFRAEALIIASLSHSHIVRLLDYDTEQGTPFLVMEYASHGSLRERHPRGVALSVEQTLLYVRQVADALQYAHDQKLIHRDIKPENLLLGPNEQILLTDFGIATVAKSSHSQSTQEAMGTVTYMAPEQIQGKPRPASDQYALGIVAYEWLTGEPPFEGSFTEIATQHLFAPPLPLRQKMPTLPQAVEQVILRALAKDPHDRFPSVSVFAQALEQAIRGISPIYFAPTQVTPRPSAEASGTLLASVHLAQPVSTPTEAAASAETLSPSRLLSTPARHPARLKGRSWGMGIVVGVLITVLVLALGGVAGAAFILGHNQSNLQNSLTDNGGSSSTSATPTPTPIAPRPTSTPLPTSLTDSLLNGNVGGWYVDNHCYFSGDGYHINSLDLSTGYHCGPRFRQVNEADVSVTVKELQGVTNYGFGIGFHISTSGGYYLSVESNGYWFVSKWQGNTVTYTVPGRTSTLVNAGLGATNVLEVHFQGSHFDFFINGTEVGQADDATFSYGYIALGVSLSR